MILLASPFWFFLGIARRLMRGLRRATQRSLWSMAGCPSHSGGRRIEKLQSLAPVASLHLGTQGFGTRGFLNSKWSMNWCKGKMVEKCCLMCLTIKQKELAWFSNIMQDWFQRKSTGKPGFSPSSMRISCRCSLHPVLGIETQPWHLKVGLPKGEKHLGDFHSGGEGTFLSTVSFEC